MRLLSYNLEKHRAANELLNLERAAKPAIICLQEARTDELPSRLGDLELFAATENNRLGLAIYGNRELYEVKTTLARGFKKTLHDRIAMPALERLLAVDLQERASGRSLAVASFHASPLTSSNRHRRLEIMEGLSTLDELTGSSALLMAGDYNYPVFQSRLNKTLEAAGYRAHFSDLRTYQKSVFRGHFDFLTSKGCEIDWVRTLPRGRSDHKPILMETQLAMAV